jgi:hypothetical protein
MLPVSGSHTAPVAQPAACPPAGPARHATCLASVLALALAALFCLPSAARADEDGVAPRDTEANILLHKELAVLHFKPEASSSACIDALKDLHTTQDVLKKEQDDNRTRDLSVAEDVLDSDVENASERCAADARALCMAPNPSPALVHACEAIDSLPEND